MLLEGRLELRSVYSDGSYRVQAKTSYKASVLGQSPAYIYQTIVFSLAVSSKGSELVYILHNNLQVAQCVAPTIPTASW